MSRPNSDEPSSFEPGLEHLVMALTAHGYPRELAGRDTALAAFRAASRPAVQFGAETGPAAARPRFRRRRRPGFLLPVRLAAVTAAGFGAAFAGVTAAAYAQALPAPVQHLAHSVLAPLGVPNSHPEQRASGPAGLPPSTAPAVATVAGQQPGGGAAPGGCPCPATSPTTTARPAVSYAVTVSAAKARVKPNAFDQFTGKIAAHGQPAKGIHVRLLERVAGSSGWRQAATGVTGPKGGVKIRVRVPASATFELATRGGSRSAPVTVTVTAPVVLKLSAGQPTDRLIVTAPSGTAGQTVWLSVRDNGTWDSITSLPLGPALQAAFALPASTAEGHYYRAELAAAGAQPRALSNALWVPKAHPHTGAKAIGGPTPTPSPTPTASGSPTPTLTPSPTASAPTPSSSALSSASMSPAATSSPAPSTAPPSPSASPTPASPTPTGTAPA